MEDYLIKSPLPGTADDALEPQLARDIDKVCQPGNGNVYKNKTPQTCRKGDKNETVRFLQAKLAARGYGIAVDGSFGGATEKAVKAFQESASIESDGSCGSKTWNCLLNGGLNAVHYMQTDSRWKDIMYSSVNNPKQTIGSSGCGPTSLSSALSALKITALPPGLCDYSVKHGYRTESAGTDWGFFIPAANAYGAAARTGGISELVKAMAEGKLAVASMGPTHYTKSGHYICVRDYDPYNRLFYTLDPNSGDRNSCDYEVISAEHKAFWLIG